MPMRSLGALERTVMDVVWDHGGPGGLTVRQVLERLPDQQLAYTTVMTVLVRLAGEDLLTRRRDGRAWRYRAVQTREELASRAMRDPLHALDHAARQSAILQFIEEATPGELDTLRRAIADVDARAKDS